MSRSFSHLRRAVFGLSCVVVFGFGATQALASPDQDRFGDCARTGYAYVPRDGCPTDCPLSGLGFCNGRSTQCVCQDVNVIGG